MGIFSRRHRRRKKPAPPPPAPLPKPMDLKPAEPDPYRPTDWKRVYEPEYRQGIDQDEATIADMANRYNQDITRGRQQGREYADDFFERSKNESGLHPQQKTALQEAANREINRNLQSQNRTFLGQQGAKGVRGGVNFAQQNELARNANQSRIGTENDIRNLDEELKLRKTAARFNIEQGFGAQNIYNRQSAEDQLDAYKQRLRDDMMRRKFSNQFFTV